MDILHDVWVAWNNQWGATVATILAIIAMAMNAGERVQKLVTSIARWRAWSNIHRLWKAGLNKYRVRRAKGAMRAKLAQTRLSIPIRTYQECLTRSLNSSYDSKLQAIMPEKPSWLNDYYVATALEEMSLRGEIAKCEKYELSNSWPPSIVTYLFLRREPGKTIEEQAEEVTSESRCLVEQSSLWRSLSSCSEESRFDTVQCAETTAPGSTTINTRVTLKPTAPPCQRCWKRKQREEDISQLVDSITEYDFAPITPIEITGRNQEFQEHVKDVCIASRCSSDVKIVKLIVEQAIGLRANQISDVPTGDADEWTEQHVADFKASLRNYIQTEMKSDCP